MRQAVACFGKHAADLVGLAQIGFHADTLPTHAADVPGERLGLRNRLPEMQGQIPAIGGKAQGNRAAKTDGRPRDQCSLRRGVGGRVQGVGSR